MSLSANEPHIRLARLDDAAGITDVHVSHVDRWYRVLEGEKVNVGREALTADERWGFGGPWMSPETCAIHLNDLLLKRGLPLVAEIDDRIVAEMELFVGREGMPYGKNCHIGLLYVRKDWAGRGIGHRMLDRAATIAREQDCDTLTVACDPLQEPFYCKYGFIYGEPLAWLEVYPEKRPVEIARLPTPLSSQSFTWGMAMPVGRLQSSAFHVFELGESFALPVCSESRRKIDYLQVAGNDAMIASIADSAGTRTAYAWSRGGDVKDLIDATLTVLSEAGASTAYMYLSANDHDALESRLDARLLGRRQTLLCRLKAMP